MAHILVVDDDSAICQTMNSHFGHLGHQVSVAHTADDGVSIANTSNVDAIIADIRLPGHDGLFLLRAVKAHRPQLPVIMITAFHDLDTTIAAMQGGASDYVPKPIDIGELDAAVERVLRRPGTRDSDELVLGPADATRPQMIGQSFAIKEVFKTIALLAQSRMTVLILGESGTGKDLVARAIHNASPERDQPFVAINCAALVETLLESELFGHEKGAFTGAVSAHKGKIELVGEGTLFLDEIAELSPAMQGKLLRILEQREYSPVGSTQIKKSKARFIAATNVDLKERVESGEFREDLFYRLNVATVPLPPLRERRSDIPLLVEALLKRINRDLHRSIRRVSGDAMRCLMAYSWPGNVRELDNVLMKMVVLERGDVLTADRLPAELLCSQAGGEGSPSGDTQRPFCSLRELERDYIERVLSATSWHKGRTCEILGISRPKLERHIQDFGLVQPAKTASDLTKR